MSTLIHTISPAHLRTGPNDKTRVIIVRVTQVDTVRRFDINAMNNTNSMNDINNMNNMNNMNDISNMTDINDISNTSNTSNMNI